MPRLVGPNGPTKVSYLQAPTDDDYVLGLDVPMHDSQFMEIGHAGCDLKYIVSGSRFVKGSVLDQPVIKIAFPYFHDEIDPVLADVVAVGGEDVGVVAEHVDLHLVNEEVQLHLGLIEGFQSCDQTSVVRNCLDDIPNLALPQRTDHLKLRLVRFLRPFIPHHL